MPVMDRQVLAWRIRLADIHHKQGETDRQRRAAPCRLGKRVQQMLAKVHLRGIVGDLGNTKQTCHLGQHIRKGTALAQSLDHLGGGAGHEAANQLRPHFGRPRVDQLAGLHLFEHGVQRVFIELAIPLGEQTRQTQDAKPRMRLHQVRGKRGEFGSHGERGGL